MPEIRGMSYSTRLPQGWFLTIETSVFYNKQWPGF
jgi:hypothetical protein